MRSFWVCFLLHVLLVFIVTSPARAQNDFEPNPAIGDAYVIGPGDRIDISIWKEPALTRTVTVLPDGSISFPLIDQIQAEGLTIDALKSEIEKRIVRFVPNPNLSVAVNTVGSLYVYVIGKVHNAGRFELNTRINVLQALAMAGGLNPFANEEEIKIFRETGDDRTLQFEFNYQEVSRGRNLEQNIQLQRGDVILVP
ncbi:MAG TPA: polysaccharide biosynthesis/export family protein [Desulfobacterales bacterium]